MFGFCLHVDELIMFTRIERYLARELATVFGAVLVVLSAVMLSNVLARLLLRVAEGRMATEALLVILGLQLVKSLTLIVPFAAFLAFMLTLGRFYRDSEMAALMACGIGPLQLYRGLFLFTVPLFFGLAWITIFGAPRAAALSADLSHRAEQLAQASLVVPGQFREIGDGNVIAYTERVEADSGELRGIFIRLLTNDVPDAISAERGRQHRDPNTGARYMLLEAGERYQGVPGTLDYRITRFDQFALLIDDGGADTDTLRRSQMPLGQLIASGDPKDSAELQWRIGVPVSLVVLVLLALPLAHASPREGRYARLAAAIALFVLYVNLMGIGKAWMEQGTAPLLLGLWWVHLVFGALATALLYRLRWLKIGVGVFEPADSGG